MWRSPVAIHRNRSQPQAGVKGDGVGDILPGLAGSGNGLRTMRSGDLLQCYLNVPSFCAWLFLTLCFPCLLMRETWRLYCRSITATMALAPRERLVCLG